MHALELPTVAAVSGPSALRPAAAGSGGSGRLRASDLLRRLGLDARGAVLEPPRTASATSSAPAPNSGPAQSSASPQGSFGEASAARVAGRRAGALAPGDEDGAAAVKCGAPADSRGGGTRLGGVLGREPQLSSPESEGELWGTGLTAEAAVLITGAGSGLADPDHAEEADSDMAGRAG
jgi:hypothetical protein